MHKSHANGEIDCYKPKLAGFWTRFWAYCIDLIVLSSIGGLFIKPIFRVLDIPVTNPSFLFFTPYKITLLIVTLLYFLLMTKYLQQTVGKIVLGIKVTAKNEEKLTWGTLVFREVIGRFISKTLVLPYLLVAFMPKKEALHDLFADTYVVHEDVYEKRSYFEYLKNEKGEKLQESPNV
ncbi:hypothetical protein BI350_06475 [Sporosarcina ureilytica]|uniref:RDD domain-containing protein n=2 Tax=Sporosarcina ureilytica TaxID=298596 RepID=A0A1D8JK84_9BACL|nr:hypothetical protein BI350_06475 [Sporosarcina ureilytica]